MKSLPRTSKLLILILLVVNFSFGGLFKIPYAEADTFTSFQYHYLPHNIYYNLLHGDDYVEKNSMGTEVDSQQRQKELLSFKNEAKRFIKTVVCTFLASVLIALVTDLVFKF